MITLPFETSGQWSAKHGQDFMADIVNTRNMNFDRPGYAGLARKPTTLFTKDDDDDFGTVMAMPSISNGTSTKYYFVTTDGVFSWDATTSAFSQLAAVSGLGFDSDAVIFNGKLHVSGSGKLNSYNPSGDTWSTPLDDFDTGYPMPICASEHQPYIAVGNKNTVGLYDDSYSLITTLTIPIEFIITAIRWNGSDFFIATRNVGTGNAKLFTWNGSGTVAQSDWSAKADWIYSLVSYQSSIVILTSAGQLLRFNGGGFDEIAHFPVYDTPYSWNTNSALTNSTGRCANRGITAYGELLYMNIDGGINSPTTDAPGRFLIDQPSGLWVYDPSVGLYHRGGYNATKYNEADIDLASSNIIFSEPHNLQTGDPVYPTSVSGMTGINANQLYYAIPQEATTIKLARSKADALAGRAVAIAGTPSNAKAIIDTFDTVSAYYTHTFPGAVGLFITDNPPSVLGGEVMYAGIVMKADASTISACMSFGSSHNVGSFTTTPLPSSGVLDTFQKLYSFIDGLDLPDAEIRVKYRTGSRYGLPTQFRWDNSAGLAVWSDDTHFTIDTTNKDFSGSEPGDEVEIIEGAGAGYTAHIAAIDDSTSSYVVEIDEAIPGIASGDKSEVIVDNWKKLAVITPQTPNIDRHFAETTIANTSATIQYKVELRGIDVSVRKLQSVSAPSKPSV